ncbi:MAG: hypothetical protein A3I44_00865 [Candidatus Sungbacteria bacterium RIFCSPLOWO2_02_FULL_51_17]|nr:MAG: hypothetical protein A2676_05750 [Candidatus Sungbacteria bacterium RIFCSPHIGHO2_01_FULL_51_22]OHA10672.1 MAG: hypothetical protein A3I44_00865 [Candidatus Sungbacteria bacterium RIFCSPLOWO2_02_FULL_51_17]
MASPHKGMEKVKEKTKDVLARLGVEGDVTITESARSDASTVAIATADARLLIGERGQNLIALEHIVKKLLAKEMEAVPRFFLDINGYRAAQADELKEEVKTIAKKVRLYRKEIKMRAMRPHERLVVHMALAEYPDITTESVGQDPERTVVIKPYP